jgi:hypothetical protein
MDAAVFRGKQGFAEHVRPILEDVEFSHRLRRAGCRLVMNPAIQVQHIFNYSLIGSLRNAFTKSLYWTGYAIGNRDLLADSGTASVGLKLNVCVFACNALLLVAVVLTGKMVLLVFAAAMFAFNLIINRGLFAAFRRSGGMRFALLAALYYLLLYPVAGGAGAAAGLLRHLFSNCLRPQEDR